MSLNARVQGLVAIIFVLSVALLVLVLGKARELTLRARHLGTLQAGYFQLMRLERSSFFFSLFPPDPEREKLQRASLAALGSNADPVEAELLSRFVNGLFQSQRPRVVLLFQPLDELFERRRRALRSAFREVLLALLDVPLFSVAIGAELRRIEEELEQVFTQHDAWRGRFLRGSGPPPEAGDEPALDARDQELIGRLVAAHESLLSLCAWRDLGLTLALCGLLLFFTVFAYTTMRRLARSLRVLTRGAREVGTGRLDSRIDLKSGDEFEELAGAFNTMMYNLKKLKQEEARAVEMEAFNYTVSHELKTPLATIQGFLEHLVESRRVGNEAGMEESLAEIGRATTQMRGLLADLLAYSRLGKAGETREDTDLAVIAAGALERLRGHSGFGEALFTIAPDLGRVRGIAFRLTEVYQNLFDNALKFTRPGVRLEVHAGVETREGRREFFVRDNGRGIDPRYLEKIFGIFERIDSSVEGSGVGLALVRRIVELHGGRCRAESAGPGQGATFYFSLPGN